ncbi:MAG: DNA mismatch repair protein MutS [Candidatus Lernaella stagnicola]|nr:DNA mismatch repair protein MutS [Candidatus Lernaella stagnicola]
MATKATKKLTPMIRQYLDIKSQYPGHILLFRMGDFYEMFFEDAEIAAKILDIALTSRSHKSAGERIPLCGIPYHALSSYLAKLVRAGRKVAICDQIEDPRQAKGIVKRAVTRVVTPGLVIGSDDLLDEKDNNYLMGVYLADDEYGFCLCDLSTGEFRIGQHESLEDLADEWVRAEPAEIILPEGLQDDPRVAQLQQALPGRFLTFQSPDTFDLDDARARLTEQFPRFEPNDELAPAMCAAGATLIYLQMTQKRELAHLREIIVDRSGAFLVLDEAAKRNLELTANLRDGGRRDSLLAVLDETRTAMGARLLKRWITYPLVQPEPIRGRLDAVAELVQRRADREALGEAMETIHDLERLAGKIGLASCNARDLVSLRVSLARLPDLQAALAVFESPLLRELVESLDLLEDIRGLLDNAIDDEPPITVREGSLIKSGYDEQVDELRHIARSGRGIIAEIEQRERQRTGVTSLKVRYNNVFGYYIEVSKANLHLVPEDYTRKQTLVNAERFITPELKEIEEKILTAQDKLSELEYDLFTQVRQIVADQVERIQTSARVVAQVDVLACFALLAETRGYCKPTVGPDDTLDIKDGRHPVVEVAFKEERFVPNDAFLDIGDNRLLLITGPNMAGKSTYIRQVALIVVMAQMGSFVPASSCHVGVVDRVFTRVGASDNLARGQSTFMVEMTETADILRNASRRSLIVLDEVGRGTSTFDGLSIAWAVAEFIRDEQHVGARTMFATHYHELTDMARTLPGVRNFNISVKEWNDDILFLRKIVPGATSRSYGIQVARLAGLPPQVIDRAKEVLANLEAVEYDEVGHARIAKRQSEEGKPKTGQLQLFAGAPSPVEEEIRAMDLDGLTPLEALRALVRLQEKCKK